MKRKVIDHLIQWKQTSDKPILLTGAKGVGKTYLALDFANSFFSKTYYINLENNPSERALFQPDHSEVILHRICEYCGLALDAGFSDPLTGEASSFERILILDEISFSPALSPMMDALELLREKELITHIIAITSRPIDDALMDSFRPIPMFPFTFDEFLLATANEWYVETIMNHCESSKPVPEIVHNELLVLYDQYLRIGGMPGAINEYISLNSDANVMEQHGMLLGAYQTFYKRYNSDSDAFKINQVYESLARQLMKDNRKFQYTLIRKGTTFNQYREAIDYLVNHRLVIRCNKITKEALTNPPGLIHNFGDEEAVNFKLYGSDVGLLYTRINEELDRNDIKYETRLFEEPRKDQIYRSLLENSIAQALQAKQYDLWFWESNSSARISFLIEKEGKLIPIEIYPDGNTRSKSFSVLKRNYNFPYAIKISSRNFGYSDNVRFMPYYASFWI